MLEVKSQPEKLVQWYHIDNWYSAKFKKDMPPIIVTLMTVAEEYKINPVGFVALAIVKSKLFCSESMANNNFFDIQLQLGDKTPELMSYSTIRSGAIVAAKLVAKQKVFDSVTEEYYNAIIEYAKNDTVVDIPRPDGTKPKEEPLPDVPQPLKPIKMPKSWLYIFALSVTAISVLSFFIPALQPIATVLKAVLAIFQQVFGG